MNLQPWRISAFERIADLRRMSRHVRKLPQKRPSTLRGIDFV
jgi:hypothetical protein